MSSDHLIHFWDHCPRLLKGTLVPNTTYVADVHYFRLDEIGAGLSVNADVEPRHTDGNGEVGSLYQSGACLRHRSLEDYLGAGANNLTQGRQVRSPGFTSHQGRYVRAGHGAVMTFRWT